MSKQRFLTVLVPIKDSDCEPTVYQDLAALVEAVPASLDNINKIYKVKDGSYYRVFTAYAGIVTYHRVYDREFPYLGRPLEIYDFTYDATRMGNAPTISAQGVMWYAEKGANDEDITLDGLWTQQCHVVFNGEKLYLKRIPTSSKSNEDARYKYDLDFVDESIVLERVYLYDVVNPFIAERPVSESATFSFFGDVYELAKRINASLIRSGLASLTRKFVGYPQHPLVYVPYLTYEQWTQLNVDGFVLVGTVFQSQGEMIEFYNDIFLALEGDYNSYLLQYIYENENGVFSITGYQCVIGKDKYGEQVTSEEKLVSFDKAYIHDALQQFHDTFELQYYITREKDNGGSYTGNVLIVVGDCEYDFADIDPETGDYVRDEDGIPMTESPFDYGVEDELLSKGKNNTTDKIVNRITGVGSTENIPWYYPNPTPDGWIKPILTRNGEEIQEVTLEYPTDEGTTSEDYTRYEKFLRNRIGNTIKRGVVRWPIYQNDYVTGSDSGDGEGALIPPDYMTIAVTYEIDPSSIVWPRLTLELDYKPSISKCDKITATLRRDDGTVIGEYDSTQTYSEPTSFQSMMIAKDGSVAQGLSPQHVYFLDITYRIPISLLPNSVEYDYEGYRYPSVGLPVGLTGLTAYASENFYQERELSPFVHWEILNGTTPAVYDCGYSTDGTPNGKVAPIPRRKGSKYKNVTNGVVYCCNKSESPSSHADFINGTNKDAFDANPKMNYEEWINEFVTMNLLVYEGNGWYIGYNRILLEDYGLSISTPVGSTWGSDIFDKIEFQRLKWLTPQPNLMPEVYIKTDGERRFYNAKNYWNADEESLIYGVADTDIGEEQVGENQVRNPIFKENETDADSEHYEFENEYIKSMPNEHIEDFDDIRPSIVGQSNYVAVPYIFESIIADWSNQYMNYFTKNEDGTYSNATPTYDPDTLYYVLLRIDVVEEFAYDLTENDEIWESSDNGSVQGEYKHPYFFAKLRPLGFNLFDMALQEDMVISMTTGHCGACNFKIGVDENSKKNPVQLWEYDVYKGDTLQGAELLYEAGTLRRYVDLTGLYYNTDNTQDGYTPIQASEGILIGAQPLQYLSAVPMYQAYNYTAEAVKNGYVGSMKERGTVHFEGDVVTDGRFIESQQDTTDNYVWVALMKDTESYGTIMPSTRTNYNDASLNQYIEPKGIKFTDRRSGETTTLTEDEADKFVFVNIKMPQIYLRRAERELSKELVKYMHEHNYQKFNFTIKFSRIYIEQNPNTDNNLNENSVLYVLYNGISYRQYVKHYSYRMTHDAPLPEISVDMNEELSVSKTIMKQWDESAKRNNDRLSSSFNSLVKQTQNRIDRTTLKKDGTYVFSGNIIVNGEDTSLIEMARNSKEGGSKGGGNAEIDESNLVHKTGDETIDGAKTFVQGVIVGESGIIDFLPTENAKDEITISNSTHDTNPQQSGATTYIGVLQFDDADTGGYVRLRGIESPALGHDAVNKDYLESAIAVYINGKVGIGGVVKGNIFAFGFTEDPTEMQITQFVKGLPNQPNITLLPVTDYLFPIGCNIYYCPNFDLITTYADVEDVMVYSSYQRVSLANNAIYRGANPLGTGEYSAVYLRVTVVDGKYWRPFGKEGATIEIIVSADQLEANNTYIYLGRSVGSSEADPVFQLEDNNPLYYYDGTDLIEYASYEIGGELSDVVHKSGAETITGEKTFSANVNLDNNATLNFITDEETPDGVYVEASETNGNIELAFSSISSDSPVILGNIHYPINDLDAANKHYVDESIENIVGTKVFLNVHTGAYGIHPKSLAAFYTTDEGKTMNITSFTTTGGNGSKEPVVGLNFPIGSKIYYYDGTTDMPSDFGITMKFYTSHKSVDARYSAIDGTNLNLGNHPTNTQSTVYLHVMVSNGYWSPFYKEGLTSEIIVSSNQIKAGNFYIYLGKTTGGSSSTNIIQLEDNNPLYYFDGTSLIDWASYIAEDSAAGSVQSITVGTTTTGEPGTNANVVNSGTPTNQILDFYIPRGADAVNPFKGWFASDTQLMAEYPNPSNGDYAYVQTSNGALVYNASGGAWRGTTIVFNPSNNQEFASGESLNLVSIINDLVTGGASNVLSAQQGVVLNTLISNLQTVVNNLSQQMPVLEKKTAQEIQILIDTGTWAQGTLYYSVEED